MGLINK